MPAVLISVRARLGRDELRRASERSAEKEEECRRLADEGRMLQERSADLVSQVSALDIESRQQTQKHLCVETRCCDLEVMLARKERERADLSTKSDAELSDKQKQLDILR